MGIIYQIAYVMIPYGMLLKQKAKKIGGISLSTLVSSASAVATSLMSDPNAVQNLLNGVDNIKGMF